ncbi:SDR family NAD(P)-dependent oxidoreductase [Paraburkholderia youngii]|nr:SDR family oxidoreductase [Paraburkholderia youngii]
MFNRFDLTGKVAALTGSTGGMGFAIARGLAEHGARVIVSSNREEDVESAVAKLTASGLDVKGVRCDVLDLEEIKTFGDKARSAYGHVDILFCLTSPPPPSGPTTALDGSALGVFVDQTISGTLAVAQQFIPDMVRRKDGSIVFMSSIGSVRALPLLGGYGAAKAALNSLVRSLAVEVGPFNVRANAIAPSFVRTNFSRAVWNDPDRERAVIAKIPAGRMADPEDVVGAAVLLASPAGAFISGQTILIDGASSVV